MAQFDEEDEINPWDRALVHVRRRVPPAEFRRWFGETTYASDSGDQITVWVPSETVRRHIDVHYGEHIDRALAALGRRDTVVRFIVTGVGEDEDD